MTFMEWTPIGYSYSDWDAFEHISVLYQGNFDGQGHIVSGLYLNNSNQDYVSLFGYNEGTIQNVGVVDSYFYGRYNVSSVCGYNVEGNITNCYNTGKISGGDNSFNVGGSIVLGCLCFFVYRKKWDK